MGRLLTKRLVLVALTVIIFLISWNRGINLLYGMFSLLLATLVIAHLFPRWALKGLAGARSHAPTAFEGDELEVRGDMRNNTGRARRMIEVIDAIPAADPEQTQPMAFIAKIGGRKSCRYTFKFSCWKRGVYVLGPITLRSGFPLGIATRQRVLPGTTSDLLVYPQVFPIAFLPLVGGNNFPLRGVEAVSMAGGSEDFFGTREYRRGDSPRYIHWPSTARHAELIVKEFEIRAATEVTIVLDLHPEGVLGNGKESTLEYAIKIAASIANYALTKGHEVQLIGYGARAHVVSAGRGVHQLAHVLEELARASATGNTPYPKAINRASSFMRAGGTAVLILCSHEQRVPEYLYSLALLKTMHVRPFCVFLNTESFLGRPAGANGKNNRVVRQVIGDGAPVYFVSKGDTLPHVFSAR